MIHPASRILSGLFAPGIEKFLERLWDVPAVAVTPIAVSERLPGPPDMLIEITIAAGGAKSAALLAFSGSAVEEHDGLIGDYTAALSKELPVRLGALLRRGMPISASLHRGPFPGPIKEKHALLRFIPPGPGEKSSAFLAIPCSLFGRLDASLASCNDAGSFERALIGYLGEPGRFFPELGLVLGLFSDRELQGLVMELRQSRLLSVYQLCLMVRAFPDHALKVKRCLSETAARDVAAMLRELESRNALGGRDLAGGVYSVEEAIYRLLKGNPSFRYASLLKEVGEMISAASRLELFMSKDFSAWLALMEEDSLLYNVLSSSREKDLALSFSGDLPGRGELLRGSLSSRRVDEILALSEGPSTLDERIEARMRLINEYRARRIRKRNWGAESFDYLLRGINAPGDCRRVLLEIGWFALSTALKGTKMKLSRDFLRHLPDPARWLIEDVLRGAVNPGIIHGELQVRAARKLCVEAVLSLWEDGSIAVAM